VLHVVDCIGGALGVNERSVRLLVDRWRETVRYLEGDPDAEPDEEILELVELRLVEARQLGEDAGIAEIASMGVGSAAWIDGFDARPIRERDS
jgi:hypothetical protein